MAEIDYNAVFGLEGAEAQEPAAPAPEDSAGEKEQEAAAPVGDVQTEDSTETQAWQENPPAEEERAAQSDEEVYIYFKATRCERLRVETPEGSASYTDEDGHIVEIGNLSAGDTVTLTFELDDAYESGTIKLIGGRHDIHAFYGMVDALRQSTWRVDEYTSTMLSGTVQAAQDGILFTSVPYEEGWTVYVDGKEVEAEAIGGGLIGIPLEQGEHIVKMVYKAPGYFPGICITLGAALIFGLILWRRGMGKNYKILQKCKI